VHLARELSLPALDALTATDLVLFCAVDERPLRAAAGYVDWRTNGWLSRLILTGQFRCQRGERLLTLSAGRLSASRIFLFGLGEAKAFAAKAAEELGGDVARALNEAGAAEVALGYPGAGEEDAIRVLLDTVQKKSSVSNMTAWGPWRKLAV